MKIFCYFIFSLLLSFQANAQNANIELLDEVISEVADSVEGQQGQWRFVINDRILICIADESNNRMRIISPVTEVINLSGEELLNSLFANFHTALDVKYAISDDVLWSVFIHPLRELSKAQLIDAISQVYYAAETFGTSYSSNSLVFPTQTPQEEPETEKVKILKLQKG